MDEYLDFARQLAYGAGKIMLQHFQIGIETEIKADEGNSPVTIADKTINEAVIRAVQTAYPKHAVLGEEQSLEVADAAYTWVCDPIDGTLPYSAGIPTNVFSLALVAKTDGQPKVAVVYDPYTERLYHATKGGGAYVNNTPLHVNNVSILSDAILGTSSTRSELVDSRALKLDLLRKCHRQFVFNSAIYEAMLVASGQLAGQVYVGSHAHDVATGKLIIEEAGGKVTALLGSDQRYDQGVSGTLMTNGLIHDEVIELITKHKL